jgi:hypothetical protein
MDTLIAGYALAVNATLVTNHHRHFSILADDAGGVGRRDAREKIRSIPS